MFQGVLCKRFMSQVVFKNLCNNAKAINSEKLISRTEKVLNEMAKKNLVSKDAIVNIYIQPDNEMQSINSEYYGYDTPTDVLSMSNKGGEWQAIDLEKLEELIGSDAAASFAEQGTRDNDDGDASKPLAHDGKEFEYNIRDLSEEEAKRIIEDDDDVDDVNAIGDLHIGYDYIRAHTLTDGLEDFSVPDQDRLVERKITECIVHGLCHLCDYDHDTEENGVKMKEMEKELLVVVKDYHENAIFTMLGLDY